MAADSIQILHIEDNPLEAALMRELVSVSIPDKHDLTGVGDLAEAVAHLAENRVDLILTDLSLPDAGGMETLRTLIPRAPGVPIIVLSGYDDEKTSLEALRAGAQDYLVKGEVSSHLLRHAIRYGMERKRLDAALSIERDLVDNLLDNIPDRIYFKDLSSRYLRINRALASIIGVEDSFDAIGKSDQDFFSAEHAAATRESEKSVIESRSPLIGHVEHERLTNGQECWVLTTKMPLITSTGDVVGTFGISRDITQMKQAEEELETAIARNRDLADSLKQLAALTANEVAAALPVLSGKKPGDRKSGTDRLELAAERLHKISRLDQETELQQQVSLKELFVVSAGKLTGSGSGLPLVFRPENFPTVLGNAELFGQLVIELLRAVSEPQAPKSAIISANEDRSHWEFTIGGSDHGDLGATEFVPITASRPPGSMPVNILALSLCRRIIELHGGNLMIGEGIGGAPAFRLTVPKGGRLRISQSRR
jgi:PAS domain S-box-containing protein